MICRRVFLGLPLLVCSAYSWGTTGHRVAVAIAEKHLNPVALKNVRTLLENQSMTAASTWADEAGRSRPAVDGWHYINIPIESANPDPDKFCPAGGCVLSKVNETIELLKSGSGTFVERKEALLFLIHLLADMHQPLHTADRGDRGGYKVQLTFFDKPTNVHMVWDHEMLAREGLDEAALVAQLDGLARKCWSRGTPRKWVLESFSIARNVAYKNISGKLGQAYFDQCISSERTQLAKAGIRLAKLLNDIWK